ncbi:hypothetical protein AX17_003245 [Amanita inopinata Kibby_2008]|nr:hypothetical protein AX17_003245 [Amanita inopinata Kibby_2008]
MFEPVRGGTRGGQAEFKWSDVSADKDREHYLGHSINAPTGRWQKNKDVHWYSREVKLTDNERAEEIRRIKELEANALAAALGFEPPSKISSQSDKVSGTTDGAEDITNEEMEGTRKLQREEKRRRKREKRARKEMRRLKRDRSDSEERDYTRQVRLTRSRSKSPQRRDSESGGRSYYRPRNRSGSH